MRWVIFRPVLVIFSLALLFVWIILNLNYQTSVHFIFYQAENVSVVLVILISFFLGTVFSMVLFYKSLIQKKISERRRRKKNSAEKKEVSEGKNSREES